MLRVIPSTIGVMLAVGILYLVVVRLPDMFGLVV